MATIFTKIIEGDIPAAKIHEDDKCIVILDINPVTKGHCLVIPKEEHETVVDCPSDLLLYLMEIARSVAKKQEEAIGSQGFNLWINNKPASGQEVPHLHIHVVPRKEGEQLGYEKGFGHTQYEEGEMDEYKEKLQF